MDLRATKLQHVRQAGRPTCGLPQRSAQLHDCCTPAPRVCPAGVKQWTSACPRMDIAARRQGRMLSPQPLRRVRGQPPSTRPGWPAPLGLAAGRPSPQRRAGDGLEHMARLRQPRRAGRPAPAGSDGERRAAAQHLRLQRLGVARGQLQHVAQLQQHRVVGRHVRAAHVELVQVADLPRPAHSGPGRRAACCSLLRHCQALAPSHYCIYKRQGWQNVTDMQMWTRHSWVTALPVKQAARNA